MMKQENCVKYYAIFRAGLTGRWTDVIIVLMIAKLTHISTSVFELGACLLSSDPELFASNLITFTDPCLITSHLHLLSPGEHLLSYAAATRSAAISSCY